MLRIKIELVPFGILPVKNSWLAEIANDATGGHSIGNYNFKIFRKNSSKEIWKSGRVENFQRLRWSIWYLLYLCLKEIYDR
jgi:hypothetical protein